MDDSAVAYSFFMIAAFLILGTIIMIFFIPYDEALTGIVNDYIADGTISEQTAYYYGFAITLFRYIFGFVLIGLLIFAYQRSVEKRSLP